MDLLLYGRVLWRFRFLVAVGTALALALAVLSYYKVSLDGGPVLSPRKQEIWQAQSTLFLTQPGFPAGRTEQPLILKKVGDQETPVAKYADPGRFTGLAALYARLANGDEVRRRVERGNGTPNGDYAAIPVADTSYGAVNPLPMISIFGTAPTPREALEITRKATTTFVSYFTAEQQAATIPNEQQVHLELLNSAGQTQLIVPRKKTLPIVVFLAGLFATVALTFVLENARPRRVLIRAEAGDASSPDIRRLA